MGNRVPHGLEGRAHSREWYGAVRRQVNGIGRRPPEVGVAPKMTRAGLVRFTEELPRLSARAVAKPTQQVA
jgi:hypothetical protein